MNYDLNQHLSESYVNNGVHNDEILHSHPIITTVTQNHTVFAY